MTVTELLFLSFDKNSTRPHCGFSSRPLSFSFGTLFKRFFFIRILCQEAYLAKGKRKASKKLRGALKASKVNYFSKKKKVSNGLKRQPSREHAVVAGKYHN